MYYLLRLCLLAELLTIVHSFQFHKIAPWCTDRCFVSATGTHGRRIPIARSLRNSEVYTTRMALSVDSQATDLDTHIPIDLEYPGLRKVRCSAYMSSVQAKHPFPMPKPLLSKQTICFTRCRSIHLPTSTSSTTFLQGTSAIQSCSEL
jgi:hypothetical protein